MNGVKIGVALSGCGIGGLGADVALRFLKQTGFPIAMLSACGTPSTAALLYAYGFPQEACTQYAAQLLAAQGEGDTPFPAFPSLLPAETPHLPVVLSAAQLTDGCIIALTDDMKFQTGDLQTVPMQYADKWFRACLEGSLCDFSVWHGCPLYPLYLAGMERILSFSFVSEHPGTPYDVLLRNRIQGSVQAADMHMEIILPTCSTLDAYTTGIRQQMEAALEAILRQILL